MKKIGEMTEQEVLALSEQDVQNMIKFRMMEEGIKILDKPKKPELFEIEPADQKVYVIPILNGYAFTDFEEAQKVADALREAKSFGKVDYDWDKLGSDFKYLEKKNRYTYNNEGDFSISEINVYSNKLYANIVDFAAQNKAMNKQIEKDMRTLMLPPLTLHSKFGAELPKSERNTKDLNVSHIHLQTTTILSLTITRKWQ